MIEIMKQAYCMLAHTETGHSAEAQQWLMFGHSQSLHYWASDSWILSVRFLNLIENSPIRTVFLTFANGWMLLNMFLSIASGYVTQLCGYVTSKTSVRSTAALNKLGFGVNMLGAHFAPWAYSLIPAECESAAAYVEAYRWTCLWTCVRHTPLPSSRTTVIIDS